MWNLISKNGKKVNYYATVTFIVIDFGGTKKIVTGVIERILKRQCEIVYRDGCGKIAYIKVATRKLTVIKYNKLEDFTGYNNMFKDEKNSFWKVY